VTEQDLTLNRTLVAQWFLRGSGIEVGALHNPLPVPPLAHVKYVDRMSATELRNQYPELAALPLVDPDIIDDGELLERIDPDSQDFIVANHFLEHCQNPIRTLQNFRRVLKPDGILFLVIPDKRYTFDQNRLSTPIDHIVHDYEEGAAWSREEHFREYAHLVEHVPAGEAAELRARQLMEMNYSIHFHVWDKPQALALFAFLNENYQLGFELRCFLDNGPEGIYILAKLVSPGMPVRILAAPPVPVHSVPAPSSIWSGILRRLREKVGS